MALGEIVNQDIFPQLGIVLNKTKNDMHMYSRLNLNQINGGSEGGGGEALIENF